MGNYQAIDNTIFTDEIRIVNRRFRFRDIIVIIIIIIIIVVIIIIITEKLGFTLNFYLENC